ncbi:hypothetical protein GWK47_050573 [Chionoecetes opilio]|uniref:Uncharacterized protein n=1 Tax=Chionoecetes opilio TaxID=41210 RepID=A0A8J5CTM4_CHIOP|nr:hypothetical protein GWK47_050573 [Chionoecetes opilio]
MVAPHLSTQLTRSLVRVPNSGRDRRAGAVLHDLSRVSSAAALVPITSYIALGLRPSGVPYQPPASPFTDAGAIQFAGKPVPPAKSPATAMNNPSHVGAVSPAAWSTPSPLPAMVSSVGYASETSAPPYAAPRTISVPTAMNPAVGRKRPSPLMLQDASLTTTEGIRSSKVPRTTTITPAHQPLHPASPRGVPTMEQLLRERNALLAENLALKQQLARRFQPRHVPVAGPVGLQVL